MSNFLGRIKQPFQDKDYRHTYAAGFLNSFIATQLKALRQQRHWTQEKLAEEAGMKQARISVLEDVNYSSWSISTLQRLARAFDLRLKVSFEEFNTLVMDFSALSRKFLERQSFMEDPLFKELADKTTTVRPLTTLPIYEKPRITLEMDQLRKLLLGRQPSQGQAIQLPSFVPQETSGHAAHSGYPR